MPLYHDLSSYYYTGGASSYNYLSGPYASHSSIVASNYARPSPSSYNKNAPRNILNRGYKPHLATISETQASIGLIRINSPKLRMQQKINYQRPISINTADIDVSSNKYRGTITKSEPVYEKKVPIIRDEGFGSQPIEPKRCTIKRDRTVVRFHTVRGENDPPQKESTTPHEVIKVFDAEIKVKKPKWRENFDPDELKLSAVKPKEDKPLSEKLKEKHMIRDPEEMENEATKIDEERKKRREENLQQFQSASNEDFQESHNAFHQLCRSVSSEKIDEGIMMPARKYSRDLSTTAEDLETPETEEDPIKKRREENLQTFLANEVPIQRRPTKKMQKKYDDDLLPKRKYSRKNSSSSEDLKAIRRNSAEINREEVAALELLLKAEHLDSKLNQGESFEKDIQINEERKKKFTKKRSDEKLLLDEAEKGEETEENDEKEKETKARKKFMKKKSNENLTLTNDSEKAEKREIIRKKVKKKASDLSKAIDALQEIEEVRSSVEGKSSPPGKDSKGTTPKTESKFTFDVEVKKSDSLVVEIEKSKSPKIETPFVEAEKPKSPKQTGTENPKTRVEPKKIPPQIKSQVPENMEAKTGSGGTPIEKPQPPQEVFSKADNKALGKPKPDLTIKTSNLKAVVNDVTFEEIVSSPTRKIKIDVQLDQITEKIPQVETKVTLPIRDLTKASSESETQEKILETTVKMAPITKTEAKVCKDLQGASNEIPAISPKIGLVKTEPTETKPKSPDKKEPPLKLELSKSKQMDFGTKQKSLDKKEPESPFEKQRKALAVKKTLSKQLSVDEAADEDFWGKIGKRETINFKNRKKFIDARREHMMKVLCWSEEAENEEEPTQENAILPKLVPIPLNLENVPLKVAESPKTVESPIKVEPKSPDLKVPKTTTTFQKGQVAPGKVIPKPSTVQKLDSPKITPTNLVETSISHPTKRAEITIQIKPEVFEVPQIQKTEVPKPTTPKTEEKIMEPKPKQVPETKKEPEIQEKPKIYTPKIEDSQKGLKATKPDQKPVTPIETKSTVTDKKDPQPSSPKEKSAPIKKLPLKKTTDTAKVKIDPHESDKGDSFQGDLKPDEGKKKILKGTESLEKVESTTKNSKTVLETRIEVPKKTIESESVGKASEASTQVPSSTSVETSQKASGVDKLASSQKEKVESTVPEVSKEASAAKNVSEVQGSNALQPDTQEGLKTLSEKSQSDSQKLAKDFKKEQTKAEDRRTAMEKKFIIIPRQFQAQKSIDEDPKPLYQPRGPNDPPPKRRRPKIKPKLEFLEWKEVEQPKKIVFMDVSKFPQKGTLEFILKEKYDSILKPNKDIKIPSEESYKRQQEANGTLKPEEPSEPSQDKFVPLQSNVIMDIPQKQKQKPVWFDECPVVILATPRDLRKRVPRGRPPTPSDSSSDSDDSSDEDDDSSEETDSDNDKQKVVKCRKSTSSNDSGFDSSAPGSPANNRNKSGTCNNSENSNSARQPYLLDQIDPILECSQAYAIYQQTGKVTPPATSIPRFRKYTVEDFTFLKVLGKGSFGKVLLAELKNTEYYYAVKCLKKDIVLEDDDVECTLIERKVLALATKHPYLCHLFCTFQTESHLFFVMEYLNGGDLMFHIQLSGRFEEYRAKFYGAEIISGLKFLHGKGIVYRDLKLDNILLDFDGHVRIADFGMCKLQIFLDRTADTFCGTPDYMAPEIIKGQHYNQGVDWWSFGVLLYEMLIGQSPFSGGDEDELFWSICNERPRFPIFLSQDAVNVLTMLLEKDASKRLGNKYCPHGDIKYQDFFRAIDWDRLENRQLEPPFKPKLQHPLDTQYFDKAFTAEKVKLTPVEATVLPTMDQAQFHGFSYTNPNATDK